MALHRGEWRIVHACVVYARDERTMPDWFRVYGERHRIGVTFVLLRQKCANEHTTAIIACMARVIVLTRPDRRLRQVHPAVPGVRPERSLERGALSSPRRPSHARRHYKVVDIDHGQQLSAQPSDASRRKCSMALA